MNTREDCTVWYVSAHKHTHTYCDQTVPFTSFTSIDRTTLVRTQDWHYVNHNHWTLGMQRPWWHIYIQLHTFSILYNTITGICIVNTEAELITSMYILHVHYIALNCT